MNKIAGIIKSISSVIIAFFVYWGAESLIINTSLNDAIGIGILIIKGVVILIIAVVINKTMDFVYYYTIGIKRLQGQINNYKERTGKSPNMKEIESFLEGEQICSHSDETKIISHLDHKVKE